jgi:aminoglycoside phosphotransferase (APT) family kinase protein
VDDVPGASLHVGEAPLSAAPRASLARLARHLIDVGLVTAADVHRHGFVAQDAGMSHAVAVVTLGDGRGFVVKELLEPAEGSQGTPEQERAIYRLASRVPELRSYVAPVIDLGEGSPFIVLDLRTDDETVASRALRTGWSDGQLASALGAAVGSWHERSRRYRTELPITPVPWVLRALDDDRPAFLRTNGFVANFLDTVVDGSLRPELATTRRLWRTTSGVVHRDLRFDNCLVTADDRMTFVDWESGGQGDPIWDLATLAQELISASSARDAPSCGPVLTGSVRLLVEAYRAACPSERWGAGGQARLVRFTAARLLQRACQLAARGHQDLEAERDRHLALAGVVFRDPSIAALVAGGSRGEVAA